MPTDESLPAVLEPGVPGTDQFRRRVLSGSRGHRKRALVLALTDTILRCRDSGEPADRKTEVEALKLMANIVLGDLKTPRDKRGAVEELDQIRKGLYERRKHVESDT